MQQLLTRKPADALKLTHRILFKDPYSQSPLAYAVDIFTLPQITEVQQLF